MDEQNKTEGEQQNWCPCPMCRGWKGHMGHGHRPFRLIRVLILIILLGVVFSIGVKFGEFKREFRNYRYYEQGYNGSPVPGGMMNGQNYYYYRQ